MKIISQQQPDHQHWQPANTPHRIPISRYNRVFIDNRPEAAVQRKMAEVIHNSPHVVGLQQRLRGMFGGTMRGHAGAGKESANVMRREAHSIQLKPKDIKETHTLHVDANGNITNAEAQRADVPVSYPMNALIFHKIIGAKPVVGGHLFKREYGGQDDFSNVVTWSTAQEQSFTNYENQYLNDAREAAGREGAHDRTIKTKAKFATAKVKAAKLPEINDGDTKKKAKQARHKVSKMIKGGVETIPTEVEVTAQGRKAWKTSGQKEMLGGDLFPVVKGAAALYSSLKAGQDVERVETALGKIDEM